MYEELLKELHGENGYDSRVSIRVMKAAAEAIEELQNLSMRQEVKLVELTGELASKLRWIPVTDRLPEQGKRYLVIRFDEVTKTQFIDILWHDAHDLWWNRLYKGAI